MVCDINQSAGSPIVDIKFLSSNTIPFVLLWKIYDVFDIASPPLENVLIIVPYDTDRVRPF